MVTKKPLKILKMPADGEHDKDYVFTWMISALRCIQENQKTIYELLPEMGEKVKQEEKNYATVDVSGSGTVNYQSTGTTFVGDPKGTLWTYSYHEL